MSWLCQKCGTMNYVNSKSCILCNGEYQDPDRLKFFQKEQRLDMVWICSNCGKSNDLNSQFCLTCGTSCDTNNEFGVTDDNEIKKDSLEIRMCEKCGTKNNINDTFCISCGNDINTSINDVFTEVAQIIKKNSENVEVNPLFTKVSLCIVPLYFIVAYLSAIIYSITSQDTKISLVILFPMLIIKYSPVFYILAFLNLVGIYCGSVGLHENTKKKLYSIVGISINTIFFLISLSSIIFNLK